ncbi:MAG: 2'-5' RNA ligase family protein [bacterium]
MTRCFLGFELSEDSRAYLRDVLPPLQRMLSEAAGWPVRLVPPENWHATLLFFKELDEAERETVWAEVELGVASGVWRGLGFQWSGLAVWPSPRRPGLICLEAPDYAPATEWPLTGLLSQHPFSKGDGHHLQSYRPHITVMRFRRGRGVRAPRPREIEARMAEFPTIDPARVRLEAVSFFLSMVSRQNPIYPRECTVPLY